MALGGGILWWCDPRGRGCWDEELALAELSDAMSTALSQIEGLGVCCGWPRLVGVHDRESECEETGDVHALVEMRAAPPHAP